MPNPRIDKVETLFEGWGKYLRAVIALPNGHSLTREIESHGDAACVLAYDPDRRTALLARQLRAPVLLTDGGDGSMLEAVAGLLDDDDPETCARREADEEVGLRLGALELVGAFRPMPGISTERIHLFLAAFSQHDRVGTGGGVSSESETIDAEEVSLLDLARMADARELTDMKTALLVQTLRLRRPDLFER